MLDLKKFIVTVALFFIAVICYSQNAPVIKQLEQFVNSKDFEKANSTVPSIDEKKLKPEELAKYNYLRANIAVRENRDDLAFDFYINSKKIYKALDSLDKVAQINIEVVSLLLAINKNNIDYNSFLNDYINYAKLKNNPKYLSQAYMQIGKSFYDTNPKISLDYFKKALNESLKAKNEFYTARIYQNMGATYATDEIMKLDSALYVYEKALKIFKKYNKSDYIFYIYTNKGVAYSKKKDYSNAVLYFLKADSIDVTEFNTKNKEMLYGYFANTYKEKGDYKKALEYFDKQKVYKEILGENEQKKAIQEIDTKYKTHEKTLENLSLKSNLKTNRIINYIFFGLLIISLAIAFLAHNNISKKRKIAEQEKLIQTQKLENTLKNQELHDIDLMLESQEKERQRIANELHDNLGSMLATLKLNFQNLKRQNNIVDDNENKLYEKTDELIEEAYQKVRNIAHLKNLGVVGSDGLVTAVKKMAEKMSILEKLTINVIPFGLTERVENQAEITFFRMIQELCTNIIKHSEATEVNIYLTQHTGEINIIIEDNGKGFIPKSIISKGGMGLRSIEKKVEQMGGTFTIDSIISKGTTIIIDAPL